MNYFAEIAIQDLFEAEEVIARVVEAEIAAEDRQIPKKIIADADHNH